MASLVVGELSPSEGSSRERQLHIASYAVLVVGGALMAIGSLEPWTYGGYTPWLVVTHRNGFELGQHNGFSMAGVPALVAGAAAVLIGALVLGERTEPRPIRAAWWVVGVIGAATGLYGLGEARWYTDQMIGKGSTLFFAGASYGSWLVLGGGSAVAVVTVLRSGRLRPGAAAAVATAFGAALLSAGLLFAPRL